MNKPQAGHKANKFLLWLSFTALVQIAVLYGLLKLFDLTHQSVFVYISLFTFLLVTGLAAYFALKGLEAGSHNRFSGFFMGGVTLKIILAGVLIMVAREIYPETGMPFVAIIAVIYLPLLILETISLVKATGSGNRKSRSE